MPQTAELSGVPRVYNTDNGIVDSEIKNFLAQFQTVGQSIHRKKKISAAASKADLVNLTTEGLTTVGYFAFKSNYPVTLEFNDEADTETTTIPSCTHCVIKGAITLVEITGNASNEAEVEYIAAGT